MTETQVKRLSGKKIRIEYEGKILEGIVTPTETTTYSTIMTKRRKVTHIEMYLDIGGKMKLIEWNELGKVKIL